MRGIIDSAFKNAGTVLYLPVFLVKIYNGELLQAASIFSVMNLLDMLAATSIYKFNFAVNNSTEYVTVIQRLQEVLLLQEKPSRDQLTSGPRVEAQELCASWEMIQASKPELGEKERLLENTDQQDYRLVNENISFTLNDGELLGVIGRVGSGKSSLLASILGETQIKSGIVRSRGSIAYVEQEPCILSDTVRNNILFGRELDEQRLEVVVEVCQLKQDLKQLVQGLDTEIGERGVNISGGQKARISLARACYSQADIILLDDPLSAVDPRVAQRIYNQCICGYLEVKARILVTHQVNFFNSDSQILVLEQGKQKYIGRYQELNLQNILSRDTSIDFQQPSFQIQQESKLQEVSQNLSEDSASIQEQIQKNHEQKKSNPNLIVIEEKHLEQINWHTYYQYFSFSCGWLMNFIVLSLTLSPAIVMGYTRFFIGSWVNQTQTGQQNSKNVIIFCTLIVGIIIASFMQTITVLFNSLYISNNLHNTMLKRVIHTPVLFFDSNPQGRIINRFSKDINIADNNLPGLLRQFFQLGFRCTLFVVLSSIVYPYLIAAAVLICVLMLLVYKMAIRANQDCQRFDAMTRSPVNSMFSASLNGLFTIRAYSREQYFFDHFLNLVNINGNAIFTYYATSRWMAYYLDLVSALYIMATMLVSLLLKQSQINTSYVAIGITSAIALSGPFKAFINVVSAVSNNMTNIQRIQEYIALDNEPFERQGERSKSLDSGEISFQDVIMRYRPNFDPVLRNITIDIKSGQKVGVVGRTGAGKSSLIHALFRMTQCDKSSLITVSGVDIRRINLKRLRQSISVIPQSPFIFEGTIRENLDPFKEFQDDTLWDALADVQLKGYIQSFEDGLSQTITDGTAFFSVGQKQLMCLARAILRNNQILVLDEATANVDLETDALIQETIQKKFRDCTVLTIAHRLDTIIESNKVLVLKRGRVEEYAHPYLLLQNRKGHFSRMVAAKGLESTALLEKRAKAAYRSQE